MKVVIFGATGMVGQGALHAALEASDVDSVLVIVRTPTGVIDPRLREVVQPNAHDIVALESELRGIDACLYCLGVSSAGLKETDYRRITVDFTRAIGDVLFRANPAMAMCFISGQGSDATGQSRTMWARVKGEAERYVMDTFKYGYAFRPGYIHPENGIVSKTWLYRTLYALMRPIGAWLVRIKPQMATTSSKVGRALLQAARERGPTRIIESLELNEMATRAIRGKEGSVVADTHHRRRGTT